MRELIRGGANVDEKDDEGYTQLIKASERGDLELVKELIGYGAKINEKDDEGWTALLNASLNGHLEIVKELIKSGANVNEKDLSGVTSLMRTSSLEIVRELLKNAFLEADPELVYQLTLIAQRLGSIDNALGSASLG